MNVCHVCGIPLDASVFDRSRIAKAPDPGEEVVLATYELHRNYCGALLYFAQFVEPRDGGASDNVVTPGYRWAIRIDGHPRQPYEGFEHVVNPWGLSGFPIHLRLDPGSLVEMVVSNNASRGTAPDLSRVGGRLLGRYWYDTRFGGAPNEL